MLRVLLIIREQRYGEQLQSAPAEDATTEIYLHLMKQLTSFPRVFFRVDVEARGVTLSLPYRPDFS